MADPESLATQPEDTRHGTAGAVSGFVAGEQVAGRYVVDGPLGRGASGEVLSVTDLSLDRSVAMKVLRGAGGPVIARFMREARLTARIDHPNVPPVHLLEFLPDGGVLFTMRRLDGTSLGEAVRRRAAGDAVAALATTNGIVQIVQRVCDALARAHALGIVHRDVKPDNIMLGAHGDVALVDWGECRLLNEPDGGPTGSTVGTPAYMSPEQARGEPADQRSDIYALGATLHHTLTGRLPTWDADPERFWERKRRGELDVLPAAIEATLPRQLLAIARRALAPLPAGRYASAEELADDLNRYQAGLAVAAYREGTIERLARWLHRYRTALSGALLVLVVAGGGAGMLWRERQRSLADWGEAVLVEDFRDDSWRERWVEAVPGTMERQGSELVSLGQNHHFLLLKRPLSGSVAIEYDGRFLPDASPGDLSAVWSQAPTAEAAAADMVTGAHWRGFWLQAGAHDNHFCAIFHRDGRKRLDQTPLRLESGRTYRIRAELDGRILRMLVDGREVTRAEELLPIGTGHIGIYAYYAGKAFSRIRVYQKQVAELQPATAVGDAFLERGQHADAAMAYQRVALSLPGTALADEARYREGLSWRLAGEPEHAQRAWLGLVDPVQRERSELQRLDQTFEGGRVGEACAGLADVVRRQPSLAFEARSIWQYWATTALRGKWQHDRVADVQTLIGAKLATFPTDRGSDHELADLLRSLGRHAEVVQLLSHEVPQYSASMRALGRSQECARQLPTYPAAVRMGLMDAGEFDQLLASSTVHVPRPQILCLMGRTAEAVALAPDDLLVWLYTRPAESLIGADTPARARMAALLHLGRYDEAFASSPLPENSDLHQLGHLLAGRPPPVTANMESEEQAWAMVAAAAQGDSTLLASLRAELARQWPEWNRWRNWLVIEPSVAPPAERAALLRQRLEEAAELRPVTGQRSWHLAKFALGRIDESTMARMPAAWEAPMWICIGKALRAELAGDAAGASQAWTAYLALPPNRRMSQFLVPNPGLERLARFKSEGR